MVEKTVRRHMKVYHQNGCTKAMSPPEAKSKFSRGDKRVLLNMVRKNNRVSVRAMARKLEKDKGIRISPSTVSRICRRAKLPSALCLRKPFISKKNAGKRLRWAHIHRNKTLQYWRSLMYTDESTFASMVGRRQWVRCGRKFQRKERAACL